MLLVSDECILYLIITFDIVVAGDTYHCEDLSFSVRSRLDTEDYDSVVLQEVTENGKLPLIVMFHTIFNVKQWLGKVKRVKICCL